MDRAARTGALSGNAGPCPGVGLLPAEDPVLALSSRHLDSCARVTRPPALVAERPAPLSPKLIPEEWQPPGFDIVYPETRTPPQAQAVAVKLTP
jgi:hypothetical protein